MKHPALARLQDENSEDLEETHDMGRGDSRNSPKMTRKKAQRKLKARLARKRTAGKAAPAKKAAKEVAPKKRREKAEKPAAS